MTRPPAPPAPLRLPGRVTGRGRRYVSVRVSLRSGPIQLGGWPEAWVLGALSKAVSALEGHPCVVTLDEEEAL